MSSNLPLMLDQVPEELRQLDQWVNWDLVQRTPGKKPTKVPKSPTTQANASVREPGTWASCEAARESYTDNEHSGVGFVFTSEDDFVGVDLDGCVDAKTGELESRASKIVDLLDGYTELSPSGTGVHIIVRGEIPRGRKRGGVEVYDTGRFFTVTGQIVGDRRDIPERSAELVAFYSEEFAERDPALEQVVSPRSIAFDEPRSDQELIERARRAANGAKFRRLFDDGDHAGYASASEADLALCSILAYWAPGDARRVDALYRQSALMRPKWDDRRGERTYGEITVATGLRQIDSRSDGKETDSRPPRTDSGNAERLVKMFGHEMRYFGAWKRWFVWDDTHWVADEQDRVLRRTKEVAREMYAEAASAPDEETRKAMARWALGSERKERRRAMKELAACEELIAVKADDIETDSMLLNCLNGTLDLRTGELRPHDPGDLITRVAPVCYDPNAKAPTWAAFLERVVPERPVREFLQRAVGYSLTGKQDEQVLFFLFGGGANGKSTFLRAVQDVLGGYAVQAAPDLLLETKGGDHPTKFAALFRARFAVCSEVEEGRSFHEVTLKRLTGGDRISARRMREDFWEFDQTHHLWLAGNHRPQVRGTDEGIWRRILQIPFEQSIPREERDPDLQAKLLAERAGILAWAVEGLRNWHVRGLDIPEAVRERTREYREEMDEVGEFIRSECVIDPKSDVGATTLYRAFLDWSGGAALSQKAFGARVCDHGLVRGKSNGRKVYRGGRLAR